MRPIHRIPSSIRIRRSDADSNRNSYHSSAGAYSNRNADANPSTPATSADIPTIRLHAPGQSAEPHQDYLSVGSWRRASASATAGEPSGSRRDRLSPSTEGHGVGRHLQHDDDEEEDEDDDQILREEMQAARRAIHDEEIRERQQRHNRYSRSPKDDFPPIRLSDDSSPFVPARGSSRRPGAVEGLAMRHRQLHKEERRQKRREQRASASSISTSSSTSASAPQANAGEDEPADEASPHPPHRRQLSDVQEERRISQNNTPQAIQANLASAQTQQIGEVKESPNRPRRNTVTEEGLMATSRRLYDTFLRRRSDNDMAAYDPEQQSALMRDSRDDSSLNTPESSGSSDLHEDEVVDYLDVVDPEVATVTALQNVGNSIFFPPIPMLYNRRSTISLPSAAARRASVTPSTTPRVEPMPEDIELGLRPGSALGDVEQGAEADSNQRSGFGSIRQVASMVSGRIKKQVPPSTEEERRKHITEWAEMDEEERNELDEHVHLLLTKKAKFKRAAKGFWRYVKTPQGFIITLYAFLITFWGTAICLFLLRWIDVGNPARQRYWIEICDQILCALFAAVGLGFAPFRAVDTYRMVQIVHYHSLTYKRRRQLHLPELKDKNELPRATPRLNMSQMTNTMMIKTGLKKGPVAAESTSDAERSATLGRSDMAADAGGHAGHAGPSPGHQGADSWELLDASASRHSGCEVEELKAKKKHHHRFLHRKNHEDKEKDPDSGEPKESRHKKKSDGKDSSSSSPSPPPTAHKTYANKDGIIPLGQLKRNPSIASELPRDAEDVVVLSPKQQANLEYQQRKFHESHTFYRYRETVTHRPFELSLMMAVVILLDCHSCLQASLGGTTWGIYYKNRPTSVTATIITFSLSCNAVAGLLIWWGGNRTKKKEEVERLLRIALEEEALRKMKKRRRRMLQAQQAAEEDWEQMGRRRQQQHQQHQQGEGSSAEESEKETQNHQTQGAYQDGVVTSVQQTPALECIHEHQQG